MGFYADLGSYVGVNVLLILIWFFTGGVHVFPWFIFPLVFWGLGVIAHYVSVFRRTNFLDRITEREYRKLKEEQNR